MNFALRFLALFGALQLMGCGEAPLSDNPVNRALKHVADAPSALVNAVEATVMLVFSDGTGTGFFINDSGLLVTNNHVLGADEPAGSLCASEGCYVQLWRKYQLGARPQREEFFLEPVVASPLADIAIFQVWEGKDARIKLATPHYLPWADVTAPTAGQTLHLIGHPQGSVKRLSSGRVVTVPNFGIYFFASNFNQPGGSGSPMVDDQGALVGVVHHGFGSRGDVTAAGVRSGVTGTPATYIRRLLQKDATVPTKSFPKLRQVRTEEAAVAMHTTYLMAHESAIEVEAGKQVPMLQALGRKCDAQLKTDARSYDTFFSDYSACHAATQWVNCQRATDGEGYKSCPAEAERDAWKARWEKLSKFAFDASIENPYQIAMGTLRFEPSPVDRNAMLVAKLDQIINDYGPMLTPTFARYLLDGALVENRFKRYSGVNVKKYILEYAQYPGYEHHFDGIIASVLLLANHQEISQADFQKMTQQILADRNLPLQQRLNFEEDLYLRSQD